MSHAVIEINNLKKYYGKQCGIDDVTFSVNEGEIFGFIGPNGAGKTTTIRTLMALIRQDSGTAHIFGKDCLVKAHDISGDVGYLPGDPGYYEHMKVKEFLNYTAELYGRKKDNRIQELCERLNLDQKRKIEDLSFGNKKKVGIVAALLHSPKLLILDEPTSGLDPLIQQIFYDIIKEEKAKGTTVLFSSHQLIEVQKICDRVAVLKEGHVIEVQSISELRKNGYKKVTLSTEEEIRDKVFDVDGIADLTVREGTVNFMYNGSSARLIDMINGLKVTDVYIEEPDLEEIFMYYYD